MAELAFAVLIALAFLLGCNTVSSDEFKRPQERNMQASSVDQPVGCVNQKGLGINGWGLIRTSYHNITQNGDYMYTNQGENIDVYILDTGIDTSQLEFGGRAKYGMESTNSTSPFDLNGHGTHVAGIIGGTTYGVAKKANLISCKVLGDDGSVDVDSIIEGINYVVQEVINKKASDLSHRSVINLSFSIYNYSSALDTATQEAINEGIFVVTMAGNDHEDAKYYSPAGQSNTITVAATDANDEFASFSNYGHYVDILAPGAPIYAAGSNYSGDCTGQVQDQCFTVKSGTDMAAAFVTGVIARYLSGLTDRDMIRISQTFVKKDVLQHLATKNKITGVPKFPHGGTPNDLLYLGCGTNIVPSSSTAAVAPGLFHVTIVLSLNIFKGYI